MAVKTLEELKQEALAEAQIEAKEEEKRLKKIKSQDEAERKEEKKEEEKDLTIIKTKSSNKNEKKKKIVAKSPIKKVEPKPVLKIDSKIQSKRASATKVDLTESEKLEDVKIKLHAVEGMIQAFPLNSCYKGLKRQMEKRLLKLEEKLKIK